jgi:uncharacterized SAM-binding protein YcdF (DUF218 family)
MKWLRFIILSFIIAFLFWACGFVWFAAKTIMMKPYDTEQAASAIVVLTGDEGRIDAGLDLFAAQRGAYLFITSVDPSITEQSIREKWASSRETPLPICCIALDYEAETTAHNAQITRDWIDTMQKETGQTVESVRLVTSNYHMPRALMDFKRLLPDLTVYPHPIISDSARDYDMKYWNLLLEEYHKFMFRAVQRFMPDFLQEVLR